MGQPFNARLETLIRCLPRIVVNFQNLEVVKPVICKPQQVEINVQEILNKAFGDTVKYVMK